MGYPFPRPSKYKLIVKRSAAGLGLFAEEDIPRGAFLIEYWGDKVTDDEANRRGGKYLFTLDNGYTIDGKTRANTARYINHACKPNAEPVLHGERVYISTRKKIKQGEEITYDYGKEYFNEYIKPHGCRCAHCQKNT